MCVRAQREHLLFSIVFLGQYLFLIWNNDHASLLFQFPFQLFIRPDRSWRTFLCLIISRHTFCCVVLCYAPKYSQSTHIKIIAKHNEKHRAKKMNERARLCLWVKCSNESRINKRNSCQPHFLNTIWCMPMRHTHQITNTDKTKKKMKAPEIIMKMCVSAVRVASISISVFVFWDLIKRKTHENSIKYIVREREREKKRMVYVVHKIEPISMCIQMDIHRHVSNRATETEKNDSGVEKEKKCHEEDNIHSFHANFFFG